MSEVFCDRKKQSVILEMAKRDCIRLYNCYCRNKQYLKQAIEFYEEFITHEINTIFEHCNSLVEIDQIHKNNFVLFLRGIGVIEDGFSMPSKRRKTSEDMYVIYITVQEWLLQGLKGQQFYSIVQIDAFNFYQNYNPSAYKAKVLTSANGNGSAQNGKIQSEKLARLRNYGEPFDIFLAFQNGLEVQCGASTSASIRQLQTNLKYKNTSIVECIPAKCTHFLLRKLFYDVCINGDDYNAQVSVSGGKYNFTGDGRSAIEARNNASRRALKKLCSTTTEVRVADRDLFESSFADKIEKSVTEFSKKIKIFTETKKIWRNVIAAIVQTTDGDLNSAKVVVLASGTKTIDGENIHHEGTVHDSHAEIIARRALMFYFYDQLDLMCDESSQAQSIFTRASYDPNPRYKLKDGIQFHLFSSRAPCGDATAAAAYSKSSLDIGKLRVKVEKNEGYLKVDDIKSEAQLAGAFHEGAVLYTASCSDKIARWNVVGIQGALLSRIIEPIYLESITMSRYKLYKENDCRRAFYGRIENTLTSLPPLYRHNKPKIAFASAPYTRNTSSEASPYSFNWIVGNPNHEKVVSKTGLVETDSKESASRISKMELMKRFVNVMQHLFPTTAASTFDASQSYDKLKDDATDYNSAKDACINAFIAKNLGNWKKVQKPTDIDKFVLHNVIEENVEN